MIDDINKLSPEFRKRLKTASKAMDKYSWPLVINSSMLECGRRNIDAVAQYLGYERRPCPSTPDGVWRNKNGSVKQGFVLYERVGDAKFKF